MNRENNVAETTQRLKCWLGWQTAPLYVSSKCLFDSCVQSPNSAYERQIRGENL